LPEIARNTQTWLPQTTVRRQKFRRFSAAVATSREGQCLRRADRDLSSVPMREAQMTN